MYFLICSLVACSLFAQEETFLPDVLKVLEEESTESFCCEESCFHDEEESLDIKTEDGSEEKEPDFNLEATSFYTESLYQSHGQTFVIDRILHQEKSNWWDLMIFENSFFGKVLAIDGTIQVTEKDEPIYHEMMAHVPLLSHDNPLSVLIVGGGDGALLREVVKHSSLQKINLVEIDSRVIELSKMFMPELSKGSFNDPRVEVIIEDALEYLKKTQDRFDVILCDVTDPFGAAKALFTEEFYANCKKCLNPEGILVNQNGVPFFQSDEIVLTMKNRSPYFQYVTYYTAAVPSYIGGVMALGWASDKNYRLPITKLRRKKALLEGKMVYYTPEIHKASFVLPQFLVDIQKSASSN